MALAKAEGFDITKEEAEAYMDELADVELDEATLAKAESGGRRLLHGGHLSEKYSVKRWLCEIPV